MKNHFRNANAKGKTLCGIRIVKNGMKVVDDKAQITCKSCKTAAAFLPHPIMHQEDGQEIFSRLFHYNPSKTGWDIVEADGELTIQRDDEADIFPDDDTAILHVLNQAQQGDGQALLALWLDGKPANKPVPIPKYFVGGRELHVDGHTADEGVFQSGGPKDGLLPPFAVFDADRQGNIAGPFDTFAMAEEHRQFVLKGGIPFYDHPRMSAWIDAIEEGKEEADDSVSVKTILNRAAKKFVRRK
jgi:hypothetical protein